MKKLLRRTYLTSIASCVLGVLVTLCALTTLTWAWFTADISSEANTIKSASYAVAVMVKENNSPISETTPGTYQFEAGKAYTVTLTASGTASTGYCIVTANGTEYHTEQIFTTTTANGPKQISFTLSFTSNTAVTVKGCWGTYSGATRDFVDGGSYTK